MTTSASPPLPPARASSSSPTSPRSLNISAAQVYALVRSGDLPAIKIGGRGQWRVEASELEGYIARMYDETREFVDTHKFGKAEDDPATSGDTDDTDDTDEG